MALSFATAGCAITPKVDIKEKTFYGSLGTDPVNGGAAVFHLFSPSASQISWVQFKAMWDDPDQSLICSDSSDFAEAKKEWEDLCAYYKKCTEPQAVKLNAFFTRGANFIKNRSEYLIRHTR